METVEEIESVGNTLAEAGKFNLEAEVVLWALRHAQANPTASIAECMAAGYNEWVK
jgi:hypothetical protein